MDLHLRNSEPDSQRYDFERKLLQLFQRLPGLIINSFGVQNMGSFVAKPEFIDKFINLNELKLNCNHISDLRAIDFARLANLTSLRLENNPLIGHFLNSESTAGLSNLVNLNLESCALIEIESGSFTEMKNLQILSLSRNLIVKLTQGIFDGLESLLDLKLDGNEIESIEPKTFASLNKLKYLDLTDNKFELLSSEIVHGLSKLERVELNLNRWLESSSARRFKNRRFKLEANTFSGFDKNLKFISLYRLEFLNKEILNGLKRVEGLVLSVYSGTIFENEPVLRVLVNLKI